VTRAQILTTALLATLLGVAGIVAVVTTPGLQDWFQRKPVGVTELYFTNPASLPSSAQVSQEVGFTFVIDNYFEVNRTYMWTITSTEPGDVNPRIVASSTVQLKPRQVWSQHESVVPTGPGKLQVNVSLQTGQRIAFTTEVRS
jgi:hypothetical protein